MQVNGISTYAQVQPKIKEPNFKGYAVTNNGVVYEEKNYGKVLGAIGGVAYPIYKARGFFKLFFSRPLLQTSIKALGFAGLAGLGIGTIVDYALNKVLAKKAEKDAFRYNY